MGHLVGRIHYIQGDKAVKNKQLEKLKQEVDNLLWYIDKHETGHIKELTMLEGGTRHGLRILNMVRRWFFSGLNIHAFIQQVREKRLI